MKYFITRKIRYFIIVLLLLAAAQAMVMWLTMMTHDKAMQSINDANMLKERAELMRKDIANILWIFLFLYFLVAIVFFFYVPVFLHRGFSDVIKLLKEITRGNYNLDIDETELSQRNDEDVMELIVQIKKMLNSVIHFDQAKKEKIIEHMNRILSLLKLAENGFIILDIDGDIKFLSDNLNDVFPLLAENLNIFDSSFQPEVNNSIVKYGLPILQNRSAHAPQQYFIPSLKRHITLKSSMVRDAGGMPIGVVIGVFNIDRKKGGKDTEES